MKAFLCPITIEEEPSTVLHHILRCYTGESRSITRELGNQLSKAGDIVQLDDCSEWVPCRICEPRKAKHVYRLFSPIERFRKPIDERKWNEMQWMARGNFEPKYHAQLSNTITFQGVQRMSNSIDSIIP